MFHLILYEPEIPPNTGNIIRLCANTGSTLHLIQPLGFDLSEKSLRRAGMDYSELANVHEYASLDECLEKVDINRIFAISTKGKQNYASLYYQPNDAFVFGPETRGLPNEVLEADNVECTLRIAMRPQSRSLNLSNAAAVIVYEAWRQLDFDKGD